MQKHTKIYLDYFGYDESSWIPCLLCGRQATEIHHIIPKSRIFGEERDKIENLSALCRVCHSKIHDKSSPKKYEETLLRLQMELIEKR